MGVVGLFFAAMILACCISPARSPAEERSRKLATANSTFGTATAATTSTMATTVTSSTRLNPAIRSRRVQLLLNLVFIFVYGSFRRLLEKAFHRKDPALSGIGMALCMPQLAWQ